VKKEIGLKNKEAHKEGKKRGRKGDYILVGLQNHQRAFSHLLY
jgi:hypothetical protein